MSTPQSFEMIFPDNADPADLDILVAASYDKPGLVRIKAARVGQVGRVTSSNGGSLIGVIGPDQPLPPFNSTYWVEEAANGA